MRVLKLLFDVSKDITAKEALREVMPKVHKAFEAVTNTKLYGILTEKAETFYEGEVYATDGMGVITPYMMSFAYFEDRGVARIRVRKVK